MRERTLQDAREGFTAHATMYVLVMAALIVLNRRVGKAAAKRPAWTNQQATTARRVA